MGSRQARVACIDRDGVWRWFQEAAEGSDAPEVLGLSWAAWWRADAEA